MAARVRNYEPLLKQAIAEARSAGCRAEADDLEKACFIVVYTTSSELLQEHGLAMRRFLKSTRDRLPHSVRSKIKDCLVETQLAWPGWRRLWALMRRRRTDFGALL